MESVLNGFTLLVICLLGVVAFGAYSATVIRRVGTAAYLIGLGRIGKAVAGAFGQLTAGLVGLLAASARTPEANKASDIAPSGGVFNYRTGKLDDGTDPVGWYEKD